MKRTVPLLLPAILIASAVGLEVLWLLAVLIGLDPDGGLEPWNAAGVILFGLPVTIVATLIALPGVLLNWSLAKDAPRDWTRVARLPGWLAIVVLSAGLVTSVGLLVWDSQMPHGSESPDQSFIGACPGAISDDTERRIEAFLGAAGYRYVNVARESRRRYGAANMALYIEGLGQQQRMIDFSGVGDRPDRMYVSLYSLPPTRHDDAHEAAVLSFVRDELGCSISQLSRQENGPDVRPLHLEFVRHKERLLDTASADKGGRPQEGEAI